MAYLFFCSLALLLRHLPRHRESIITIPIMATPSFMPSQMESNGSTVHLSQRVRRHFASDAQSPVEHLHHECPFPKKRWYLDVSVNGRLAAVERLRIQRYSRSRSGGRAFPTTRIARPCLIYRIGDYFNLQLREITIMHIGIALGIIRLDPRRADGAWQ